MNRTRALEVSIQAVEPVSTSPSTQCLTGAGAAAAVAACAAVAGAGACAACTKVSDVASSNRTPPANTQVRIQPGRRARNIAVASSEEGKQNRSCRSSHDQRRRELPDGASWEPRYAEGKRNVCAKAGS